MAGEPIVYENDPSGAATAGHTAVFVAPSYPESGHAE